jgi:hypothetical protein
MQNPGQPSKESLQIARAAVALDPKAQTARSTARLDDGMRREVARKGKETIIFYQKRLGLLLEEICEVIENAANDLNMSYAKVERDVLALKNINTKTRAPSAWNGFIATKAEELREGKPLAFCRVYA